MNQKNNYDQYMESYIPEVEFYSYVPDDLMYAPAPDLWFKYSIKDPLTGGPLLDQRTNLVATDFIAYSVEYEGEYYWTYNVYMEEVDGYEPIKPEFANKWSPADSMNQFPQSFLNTWDVNIESYERNLNNGDLTVLTSFQTTYPFLSLDYDLNTNTYEVYESPSYGITGMDEARLRVNGNSIKYYKPNRYYLFYDTTYFPELIVEYNEHAKEKHYFEFVVPNEEINNEDVEIKFTDTKILNRNPSIGNEDTANLLNYKPQIQKALIPINDNNAYNIKFNTSSNIKEVKIPYFWLNGEPNKYETFKFEKLFKNSYDYPTTTKDLLKVTYKADEEKLFPDIIESTSATVNIDGYPKDEFVLKKKYQNNSIIFYIDEQMYYDYENENVELGYSSDGFINENGLVLPWDDKVSGTINFSFESETYQKYNFNIELKIGNENYLRGSNGKYEIVEV